MQTRRLYTVTVTPALWRNGCEFTRGFQTSTTGDQAANVERATHIPSNE